MNLEYLIAEDEWTHPDYCEKVCDGTKDGLWWSDAHDPLREIEAIDCHVQCGENWPFGRQDLSVMVGMRSGHEEAMRR